MNVETRLEALFGLAGKRALVTGGTSGIGLAIAEAFAGAGADVLAASDREADCAAAASALHDKGLKLATHCIRLSGQDSAVRLAEAARERLGGPVDILISNAGIEGPVGLTGAAAETDYLKAFDVNLHSAYWLAAALAPGMREASGGAIVLMASVSAMRGNRMIGTYAMSKAALAQLARNLAVELGPHNIRANAIAPGLIETPFSRGLMSDETFMRRRLAATPLRRVGQPHEIAATALWLVSPGGAYITGQTIVVDGGTLVSDGS
jgi:NAD(P)-dependent dehydrogenase (short-subunit alcohol dehydrogenase family)